jgi:4a-hydroxytetrahydrobiopterin dehydratase
MRNLPLALKNCVPCHGGVPTLKGNKLSELQQQLAPPDSTEPTQWNVVGEHHLVRAYKFSDFKSALVFVNRVGELAEQQGHHPDILLGWGKVEITLWTHAVDGLTESDFILAAKINQLS